jgi:hypothetical protein
MIAQKYTGRNEGNVFSYIIQEYEMTDLLFTE